MSSTRRSRPVCNEIREPFSGCVLTIDRDRRIVDANEPATRVLVGPARQGSRQIERMTIEWFIADVIDQSGRSEESIAAICEADDESPERQLHVIARRLDGMKFHARVRIVPTEDDPTVSHIVYLHELCDGAVF